MRFSTLIWNLILTSNAMRTAVGSMMLLSGAVSCGTKPKSSGQHEGAAQYSTADFLKSPPDAAYVRPGSREIVITPEPDDSNGLRFVQLFSEPGAEIYFSLLGEDDLNPGRRYQSPIVMVPPFEIFAVAVKDGERGPVRSARFGSPDAINALSSPNDRLHFVEHPDMDFASIKMNQSFAQGSTELERLSAIDPSGDVPSISQATDLVRYELRDFDQKLSVRIELQAPAIQHPGIVYGVEVGPSHIKADSFGAGAEYIWRVDCNLKTCRLTNQKQDQEVENHGVVVQADQEGLHIEIPKASLGEAAKSHLAIRAFAIDARRKVPVLDRSLPIYFNSPFEMHSLNLSGMSSGAAQIQFFLNTESSDRFIMDEYASLVSTLGPLIEETNHYPLFNQGSTPFFIMPGSNSGFTGINSTDRGLFSALGTDASKMALIQLIAHEFAHFQNSGWSRIDSRWIQEGYSEWTAQRIMYRKLPSRAVYRFLYQLRIKPFQKLVEKNEADSPLNEWNSLETNYGYEKVFAFFQLLEREVGVHALIRAQLIGRNQELDTDTFQELLEKLSGKNLDQLFSFWVRPGPVYPDFDPAIAFADADKDGILAIDEQRIGTSDLLRDSDLDGFEDGEAIFNPSYQRNYQLPSEPQAPLVLNQQASVPNDFLRIQSASTQVQISRHPLLSESGDFEQYRSTTLMRPPFGLLVRSGDTMTQQSIPAVVRRPDGSISRIEAAVLTEGQAILPAQPIVAVPTATIENWKRIERSPGLTDAASDVPDLFSGLDIVSAAITEESSQLRVNIKTRGSLDRYGEFGGFYLEFGRFNFAARALPNTEAKLSIRTMGNSSVVFGSIDANRRSQSDDMVKLQFNSQNSVDIVIGSTLIADFLSDATNSHLCVESQISTDTAQELRDRAGCIQLRWSGFDFWRRDIESRFGEGVHQIDLMVPSAISDPSLNYLKSAAEAGVSDFQSQLQRPLWDRYHWPIRIMFNRNAEIWTDLDRNFGVFLSSVDAQDGYPLAGTSQLMLEQMARLILPDVRERMTSRTPLWLREFFATWLGISAAYSFAPTRDVHEFNHDYRISHYLCYHDVNCSAYARLRANFSNERGQALNGWQNFYDNSLAQQKLQMSLLELHSLIGNHGMRTVMGSFYNAQPTSDQFIRILSRSFPDQTDALDAWSDRWGLRDRSDQTIIPSAVLPLFQDSSELQLYPVQRQYLLNFHPSLTPVQYESSW